MERQLTIKNVGSALAKYSAEIARVGESIQGKCGLELLHEIKRGETVSGPYKGLTLFEAANRIMTDLVILNGVKWLLEQSVFPFSEYRVEYGNENANAHDIMAESDSAKLVGEAFNVAPTFFQGKKRPMLHKLRNSEADFRIIVANEDAVSESYLPKLRPSENLVLVDVFTGKGRIVGH